MHLLNTACSFCPRFRLYGQHCMIALHCMIKKLLLIGHNQSYCVLPAWLKEINDDGLINAMYWCRRSKMPEAITVFSPLFSVAFFCFCVFFPSRCALRNTVEPKIGAILEAFVVFLVWKSHCHVIVLGFFFLVRVLPIKPMRVCLELLSHIYK